MIGRIGRTASRALDGVDTVIDVLSAVSLMLITAIVFLNATGRYFLSFNLLGAEEASRLLMVTLTFVASYTLLRRGGHITVDVVTMLAPPAVLRIMRGLVGLLVVGVMGFLAVYTWQLVAFSAGTGQRSTTLPVPRYFFFLPTAVGATLSTLAGIETVLRAVTDTLRPIAGTAAQVTADAAAAQPDAVSGPGTNRDSGPDGKV